MTKTFKNKEDVRILPIDSGDVLDVFELSNQESVRANSFNHGKIELDGHKNWFAKKLKDKNSVMLKALINHSLAGQVRLDIEKDSALVGISVSEDYRGRGLGTILIDAAVKQAKKRNVQVIEAYIKPENLASVKLFEKSGFIFNSETEVSGCKALKYINKIN